MRENFFELRIFSSEFKDEIIELLFALGISAIEEKDADTIIVRDEYELDDIASGVNEYVVALAKAKGKDVQFSTEISQKPNEDWVEKYKQGVRPVSLGNFYVRPTWEEPKNGSIDLLIDPALAFGSGHHESTAACILNLQTLPEIAGKSALDVGCGSGILSIAMTKLGCVVDACDTDELAIEATKTNSTLNGVTLNKTWVGSISNLNQTYDIVVANIIADVILMLSNELKNSLKPNGYLLLAGVLEKYSDRILKTFSSLELISKKQDNDWVSFIFKRGN
ncbi:50S ribosomal protein L11 methyltransferase [Campylobacter sp. 19-13652]|uniref:50S ribosomal protein L11 methyltransferase n=1 Tax=Campylobacter sp. 19-13652 TaxID=2840180 RepID=UPI001C779B4A|nr:50S ribosomal protein L11 methyltransferase [Campylobacter sp. 19-13652]BCX79927.1 ribosomal protein L11 methyltransferase [Campylobacter sp. 19-13652]